MMQKSQSNKKFSGMSMVIGALLDLKKKAEEEALAAIESGNKKEIEVLQSSMDEGKISALITVSNLLHYYKDFTIASLTNSVVHFIVSQSL